MRYISPEEWVRGRYLYEYTETPIAEICGMLGCSAGTLQAHRRRENWRPRRPRVARQGPPPLPAWGLPPTPTLPLAGEASAGAAPVAAGSESAAPFPDASAMPFPAWDDPVFRAAADMGASTPFAEDALALVPRLQSATARVLPAIEATIARLTVGAHHPGEMERASRTLGALSRTLRELNALLDKHRKDMGPLDEDADDEPADIDAFRIDLARRIDAFVESRTAEDGEANAEET